jgi:hypothetical protein
MFIFESVEGDKMPWWRISLTMAPNAARNVRAHRRIGRWSTTNGVRSSFALMAMAVSVLGTGCAAYQPPPIALTNPANPEAVAAPSLESSNILKRGSAQPTQAATPSAADAMSGHGGHEHHMHGGQ